MKHQKIIANNIKIRQILSPIRKEKNQNSRNFRDKEPKWRNIAFDKQNTQLRSAFQFIISVLQYIKISQNDKIDGYNTSELKGEYQWEYSNRNFKRELTDDIRNIKVNIQWLRSGFPGHLRTIVLTGTLIGGNWIENDALPIYAKTKNKTYRKIPAKYSFLFLKYFSKHFVFDVFNVLFHNVCYYIVLYFIIWIYISNIEFLLLRNIANLRFMYI